MKPPSNDKDALRKILRQQRSKLSSTLQKEKSKSIVLNIEQSSAYTSAYHIALYYPVQGEVDLLPLTQLNTPSSANKQFSLPILQAEDEPLLFARTTNQSKFEANRFSIPEPIYNENDLLAGNTLDLVLMPLLGFDKKGNRLGMGGGFYDRTFAFLNKNAGGPLLMGIAYDFQEVASLHAESWDIPLDFIATESRLISARKDQTP